MDPVEQRMQSIEARLAVLETAVTRLGRGPDPVARPAPIPAPIPAATPRVTPPPLPPPVFVAPSPIPARPPRPAFDLERFLGLAVLGRVGIAAVVLAAAYFGQLGWGRLSPAARVLVIYAGAVALVLAGWFLRPRVQARYVAFLWGGATGLAYLAGVVARLLYQLVDAPTALGMLVGAAAMGQLLARRLGLQALATVALAGAYAAPVLVGEDSASPTGLYVYLLTLHAWAAWTEWRWQWSWARRLAATATVALAFLWFLSHRTEPDLFLVLHCEAILVGVAAPELLAVAAGRPVARLRWLLLATGAWLLHPFLMAWTAAHDRLPALGLVAGGAWLAVAALTQVQRERSGVRPGGIARLGGVLLAAGSFLVWNSLAERSWELHPWQRLVSLAATAGLLLLLRRRVGAGELGAFAAGVIATALVLQAGVPTATTRAQAGLALLVPLALVLSGDRPVAPAAGLLLGSLLTFFGVCQDLTFADRGAYWLPIAFGVTGGWSVLGTLVAGLRRDRFLVAAAALLLLALGSFWTVLTFAAPATDTGGGLPAFANLRFATGLVLVALLVAARRTVPAEARPWGTVAIASEALGLLYLAGLSEVLAWVRPWQEEWSAVAVSVYSMVFAAGLLVAGFLRRDPWLRWPGLVGFGAVVIKVAVYDLGFLSTPLRVLVTGLLGLALLLAAWGYARKKDAVA